MLYEKIFLSLAGREDEAEAIREAMRVVSALQAKLTVLHINDPGAGKAHMMMDTLPEVKREDLSEMITAAGFAHRLSEIEFRMIRDESYADAIAAATREADLLIMGHHPKNRLTALVTDSTDEHVADRIRCPVLLVPLID